MMDRILIIEDEYRLLDMLKDFFSEHQLEVCTESDGQRGYETARDGSFDTIVLDVMLPGMDGFSVLRKLRGEGIKTPVLMLTARTELSDKLEGLTQGADDYLTKPFAMEELLARVQILLRKNELLTGKANETEVTPLTLHRLSYEDLHLDENRLVLSSDRSAKEIRLPAKEYALMTYFMKNPGQLLSKEQISIQIWGYESDAEYNQEEVYISFLRKKLKYLETDVEIENIRGAGYRMRRKADAGA